MYGRLIVRRVKRLNPDAVPAGQDELFTTWRHHAVFVTSRFAMLQAEGQHRDHAIVEQVIADAAGSALAHLPSGSFNANAAWAVLWAIAHNLTRAAGTLASMVHARATTATIRAHLINVPARIARGARRLTLHLPEGWPWEAAWTGLHAAVHRPARTWPDHPPDQGPTGEHAVERPGRPADAPRPQSASSRNPRSQSARPDFKRRSVDPG